MTKTRSTFFRISGGYEGWGSAMTLSSSGGVGRDSKQTQNGH